MEAPWQEWEEAAAEVIASTNTSTPVDAFRLATACQHEVRFRVGANERRGNVIYINPRMRPQRQHGRIAHELGHFVLERHEIVDSEPGAKWAGGALLLPRLAYSRDLTRTAWSITRLRELHVNASATACAVRITQLRDAVASVIDPTGRRAPWRTVSPWIQERRLRRVSAWERKLAARAYETREEVQGDQLCWATPLLDGPRDEHRVLVVCELEQLSFRL